MFLVHFWTVLFVKEEEIQAHHIKPPGLMSSGSTEVVLVAVEMGATGAFRTAIVTILQIQVIMCTNEATVVTGKVGQGLDFPCEYPADKLNNSKFFCRVNHTEKMQVCSSFLIRTQRHDRWVTKGRLSLFDNISAGVFVVRMDRLDSEDRGMYLCGVDIIDNMDYISVIQLKVTQTATPRTVVNITLHSPGLLPPANIIVDKRNLPMFLTVVSCLAALLFVCLFTLCLVVTVRKQKAPRRGRQMSSDYETMTPGVFPELNPHICPDSNTFHLPPPPPPGHFCDSSKSKQRESAGPEDHTDMDLTMSISQYQNLDLSSVEECLYYGINNGHKASLKD